MKAWTATKYCGLAGDKEYFGVRATGGGQKVWEEEQVFLSIMSSGLMSLFSA